MHFAIRKLHLNYLNEIETKTIKPTAVPNDKNTHQNKNKPAPKNVLPSAQDRQEVVLPSAQNGQKVSMFESKEEVKRKNSGCALRRKQEPSREIVAIIFYTIFCSFWNFIRKMWCSSRLSPPTMKPSIEKELKALECEDLESGIEKVKKSNLEKDFESLEIAQGFESLVKQAHKQLEDKLLEELKEAQELQEKERKDDENDLVILRNEFEQELQDVIAESKKIMETQQDQESSNEETESGQQQKAPVPILIISPSTSPTTTPSRFQNASPEIVTPEPKSFKPSQKLPNFIQDSKRLNMKTPTRIANKNPTAIPSKKPKNSPTKLPKVTPSKTPIKHPNIGSAIVSPEGKPPNTKPPKKPPPDSIHNNHDGGQRVRVGAADNKPGQHRNKVRWKDAAPNQRVSGRENYDKKRKDAAQVQRVPGQKQRDQKGPQRVC